MSSSSKKNLKHFHLIEFFLCRNGNFSWKNGDKYVLEFALAGWKESEIKVELEKNILKVTGQKADSDESGQDFVHRGIANRSFHSQFTIGDNIKIVDGKLEDGVLTINMDLIIPEEDKPRTITIVSS